MPTGMTFSSLQDDVRAYLERGSSADHDVYAQIPKLINFAERRISRELKVQGMQRVVNTTLVSGTSVYAKPDRWRDTKSINIGTGTGLNQRTTLLARAYEYCRAYWPDEGETEVPLFYADYNADHWLISPTPDAAYPMEVVYYELLPLLDDNQTTNWLTEQAPQLLLYGTLLEAAPFLKNDERIPTWQAFYDRAAAALSGEDLGKILDNAATRTEA